MLNINDINKKWNQIVYVWVRPAQNADWMSITGNSYHKNDRKFRPAEINGFRDNSTAYGENNDPRRINIISSNYSYLHDKFEIGGILDPDSIESNYDNGRSLPIQDIDMNNSNHPLSKTIERCIRENDKTYILPQDVIAALHLSPKNALALMGKKASIVPNELTVKTLEALEKAENFICGFEDDGSQGNINSLLKIIRSTISLINENSANDRLTSSSA